MTIRLITKRNLPRPKPARAIHYAASKWEPYVYRGFYRAIRQTQTEFKFDEVRAALERNAPEIAVAAMPWPQFERALERNLLLPIRNAVADGAAAAARDLKPRIAKRDPDPKPRPTNFQVGAEVSFTLDNPRTQSWLARYSARLVRNVRNETVLAIRRITTDAHARGVDVRGQATQIATALRRDIGLNQRQAGALSRYEAGLMEQDLTQAQIARQVNEYRDRLIAQRSRMIARHETLSASNAGQQEVWQQAKEQGLLPGDAKRKWITQPGLNATNPCPICRPMNGQIRGLNEPFVSPYDGSTAMVPGIHISCECVTALIFED